MRERTLRHLLLLVGKAIAESEIDSELSILINGVSKTLAVSREKRSPYLITWKINDLEKSLIVEDSLFKFHVRGDVPNRNPQNEDIRSSNWDAACSVWSNIIGMEVKTNPDQLAPQFFSELAPERFTRALQISFSVLAVVASFLWSPKTGVAIFGVLAINECLKLGDSFSRRRVSLLITTSLAVATSAVIPGAAPAFIALLALEMITAILVFTLRETVILALGFFLSLLIAFSNSGVSIRADAAALAGFILFSLLAVATLPLGKSGNLRRISVMFSIGVLFLCGSLDVSALWICSLFGILGVFPWTMRRTKATLQTEDLSVTPVSIRQSRGL